MWLVIQIALILLLAAAGGAAPWAGPILNLAPPSTGAFTGALIASAAAMLGALLTRLQARTDKQSSDAERRRAIRTILVAELVDLTNTYIGLQRTLSAALSTIQHGGSLPEKVDLSDEMPRPMPFADSLRAELLILSPQEIDIICVLSSNIDQSREKIREFAEGRRYFGHMGASLLGGKFAHDMNLIAEAFEKLSPSRKLTINGGAPELASVLLRRLAAELNSKGSLI